MQQLSYSITDVIEEQFPIIQNIEVVAMYSSKKTVSTIVSARKLEEHIIGIPQTLLVHVDQFVVPQPNLLEADDGGVISEKAVNDLLVAAEPVGPILALPAILVVHALVDRREDVKRGAGNTALVPELPAVMVVAVSPSLRPRLAPLLLRHCDDS